MRRTLALIALLTTVSCARFSEGEEPSPGSLADDSPAVVDERRLDIYEAVIRALYETEGWYDPVLISERICPGAGDAMKEMAESCDARFGEEEQAALLGALSDLPSVRFVPDPERVTRQIFEGELRGAGLLSVGPIRGDGDRVEVPGNAYCGGLCGHWMTWVIERGPDGWAVTGTTGPSAIA